MSDQSVTQTSCEDAYWDRCGAGENPDAVAADMPEMARTHRNVSALMTRLVESNAERDDLHAALAALKAELRLIVRLGSQVPGYVWSRGGLHEDRVPAIAAALREEAG